jgi:SAM-dependent methyltransferase
MRFPLLAHNDLTKCGDDIWSKNQKVLFDYSDGSVAEEYLKNTIENATDLSSASLELDNKIIDWISECHLSSQRANLLRALNLDRIKTALEIGCGCGAMTRYLGEQGMTVDAVEGNIQRACITRRRCRELQNVNVIHSNFNDLTFPENSYDAVFLIGVLEYAGKYLSYDMSNRQPVVKILSMLKKCLNDQGVMVIAIENRMGLKYWMGASEDHYGEAHVGLYGYPQNTGIRTFDRNEWQDMLVEAGMESHRFIYPFPDYKLPRVLMDEAYIASDANAHALLYRIPSRDYSHEWSPDADEYLLWRNLHRTGYLKQFSNSFLIAISDSPDRLESIFPFDFAHLSDIGRKPEFRTMTVKPKGCASVHKRRLIESLSPSASSAMTQGFSEARYISGTMLSGVWLDALVGYSDTVRFDRLVDDYYQYLLRYFADQGNNDYGFDLIPANIILNEDGAYHAIDREWRSIHNFSPDYILFRAILWTFHGNQNVLKKMAQAQEIGCLKDFIEFVFHRLSLPIEDRMAHFIEMETRIQTAVTRETTPGFIRDMLLQPLPRQILLTNEELTHRLDSQGSTIMEKDKKILNLQNDIRALKMAEAELSALKQSRSWKAVQAINHIFRRRLLKSKT